ncbi:hypothetical protein TNCT_619221 [Trichonephila clavata]|uniref:RNase H type-1 domain-containing protein n=1 Tax=Trichonephila clavata TaxID=2740835 RepID=A0A8X6HPW4_TRICU|nr:hypothetical protein TNCT_619221 [Trichonephila clavata]
MILIWGNNGFYRTASVHYSILVAGPPPFGEKGILVMLMKVYQTPDVHLQWLPSHVNSRGIEMAGKLANQCCENETATGTSLPWLSAVNRCDRGSQTALSR